MVVIDPSIENPHREYCLRRLDVYSHCYLTENHIKILKDIAVNGPIDVYRASKKRLFIGLSTTQASFKKLTESGFLQLVETVKSDTDQIRKIYGLTHFGLCAVITLLLYRNVSDATYEDIKACTNWNADLFPNLLKKWDFFIDHSKEYYSQNPVNDWNGPSYLIPMPDISTELWCLILLKVCDDVIDNYGYGGNFNMKEISEKVINGEFIGVLDSCISGYLSSPHSDGFIFALKQDKELCADIAPIISMTLCQYKNQVERIEQILNEIK